ncbi:MAG: hypothetical protein ACFFD5_10175 [Candidatus Thorarchaeota archaeon]
MERKNVFIILSLIVSITLFLTIFILFLIDTLHIPGIPSSLIPHEYIDEFILILPGPIYTDVPLLFLFPLLIFALYVLIAPIVTHVLYKVHEFSFIFRIKPRYGILRSGIRIKTTSLIYRAVLVSLFAFGTIGLIAQFGYGNIFRATVGDITGLEPLIRAENVFFGTFFFTSLSLILFVPIWILEDCGIVAYRSFRNQRKLPVIQGVHKWYMNVVEIYTGFSTISAYLILIFDTFGYMINELSPGDPAILTPIILLFLPLIVIGLFAIPLYLYERYLDKVQKRVHSRLIKYNVSYIDIPSFDNLEVNNIE